jgi:hypothetical protein
MKNYLHSIFYTCGRKAKGLEWCNLLAVDAYLTRIKPVSMRDLEEIGSAPQ